MIRISILLGFFIMPFFSNAQGEMLLLKKKGKVYKSYYAGSNILFDAGMGMQEAQIYQMKNDSIFMVQYDVRQVMTTLGIPRWDTVGSYRFTIDYKDIRALAEMPHGWNWHSAGTVLLSGGTLLTAAGLLTWVLAKKDTRYYARPEFVGTAAALAVVGFLLLQTKSGKRWPIGKKYTLLYIGTH